MTHQKGKMDKARHWMAPKWVTQDRVEQEAGWNEGYKGLQASHFFKKRVSRKSHM